MWLYKFDRHTKKVNKGAPHIVITNETLRVSGPTEYLKTKVSLT